MVVSMPREVDAGGREDLSPRSATAGTTTGPRHPLPLGAIIPRTWNYSPSRRGAAEADRPPEPTVHESPSRSDRTPRPGFRRDGDWVRNVLAAGECVLETRQYGAPHPAADHPRRGPARRARAPARRRPHRERFRLPRADARGRLMPEARVGGPSRVTCGGSELGLDLHESVVLGDPFAP